ncbi:CYTH and CHAD domain-containing protein [Branchiibius sp. NY16-3462-2]|uniref:CYTH and CHAD domain-containing protein n=1 Tax=Branchiibius sp. NY16-3462-2 TaxID=1807500 RepID=UPI0007957A09|nr:CYTH and CHAD domain-containing protein [Branchiibius sp. NY16-3462-2]KYH45851.1 hypothetical protein AZH51_09195 [Branchiibius sp. NY16-3462-2]
MSSKAKLTKLTEIERKFSVPSPSAEPSFDGLTGIARADRDEPVTMEATYYDTADLDLLQHRITLRRRVGGSDEAWHLKLPQAAGSRSEVHAPLSDDLPAELRSLVAAIVRDRELTPLATLHTSRTVTHIVSDEGAIVAEFADDEVVGVDLRTAPDAEIIWHEWEVELIGTTDQDLLERLCRRLTDAGAQPSTYPAKLVHVVGSPPDRSTYADPTVEALARLTDDLVERDRWVRENRPDGVHQMRVTSRRIRSLLRSHPALLELPGGEHLESELRELAATLGVARDAEVLAKRYQQALAALPPELIRGRASERLVANSKAAYTRGLRRAVRALDSERYFQLLDGLDALAGAAADGDFSAAASVAHARHKLRKAAKKARKEPSDVHFHSVRKKAKQLRYVAEAAGRPTLAKRAKAIQTLLGDHQDSVVSRAHLLETADKAAAAGEDTFTYGLLWQRDAQEAEDLEQQLPHALRRLNKVGR